MTYERGQRTKILELTRTHPFATGTLRVEADGLLFLQAMNQQALPTSVAATLAQVNRSSRNYQQFTPDPMLCKYASPTTKPPTTEAVLSKGFVGLSFSRPFVNTQFYKPPPAREYFVVICNAGRQARDYNALYTKMFLNNTVFAIFSEASERFCKSIRDLAETKQRDNVQTLSLEMLQGVALDNISGWADFTSAGEVVLDGVLVQSGWEKKDGTPDNVVGADGKKQPTADYCAGLQ